MDNNIMQLLLDNTMERDEIARSFGCADSIAESIYDILEGHGFYLCLLDGVIYKYDACYSNELDARAFEVITPDNALDFISELAYSLVGDYGINYYNDDELKSLINLMRFGGYTDADIKSLYE